MIFFVMIGQNNTYKCGFFVYFYFSVHKHLLNYDIWKDSNHTCLKMVSFTCTFAERTTRSGKNGDSHFGISPYLSLANCPYICAFTMTLCAFVCAFAKQSDTYCTHFEVTGCIWGKITFDWLNWANVTIILVLDTRGLCSHRGCFI